LRRVYLLWVGANALAELVGLALAAVVTVAGVSAVQAVLGTGGGLGIVAVAVLAGAVEGAAVGYFQWQVLRGHLVNLRRAPWIRASAVGAAIAWPLGFIAAFILGGVLFTEQPGALTVAMVGAGFGLALGGILGFTQWVVLREHVKGGGWWIIANALAWTVGIIIAFVGASLPTESTSVAISVALAAATGLAAGVIVGAIHGAVLVWLLARRPAVSARAL